MKTLKIYTSALAILALALAPLKSEEIDIHDTPFYPESKSLEGLVITIDPGHGGSSHQGGYHGSARGTQSRVVEGDLNIRVATLVRHYLKDAGAQVHMTRYEDRKVTLGPTGRAEELGARPALAEETRSHLFLSLHHNSAPRETADGVVVLIWPTDSKGENQPLEIAFADILEEELKKTVPWKEDFTQYIHDHPLSAASDIPSAVVEYGFLSNVDFDAWVVQRGSAEQEAIGTLRAVERMWKEFRPDLEAKRKELFPDAEPVVVQERSNPYESLYKRFWPGEDSPDTVEEINHVINLWKRIQLSDHTFFYVDWETEKSGDTFEVQARVNHPYLGKALTGLLEASGLDPASVEITLLPDNNASHLFGVVQIPMALTWGEPKEGVAVQTQLLLGENVWILDQTEDKTYYLVHGNDGYIGWVRADAIRPMTEMEFSFWNQPTRYTLKEDYMVNDFRVPAGSRLPLMAEEGDDSVTLRLPQKVRGADGEDFASFPKEILYGEYSSGDAGEAADWALSLLKTPYVFGAKSSQGIDCSGLVGIAYRGVGVQLPRDARQQILVGFMTGNQTSRELMEKGDILYFIDDTGRTIHTGIYLGEDRFVHASPPEVQVSSLNPEDPLYSENWSKAFFIARRPLH